MGNSAGAFLVQSPGCTRSNERGISGGLARSEHFDGFQPVLTAWRFWQCEGGGAELLTLPAESRNAVVDALEFERQAMKWYAPGLLCQMTRSMEQ